MDVINIGEQFTVFLPVKNGGNYLPLCVESILAQNYQNFELIILENQSTDGTAEWLQSFASRDSRIKVIPSESPLSIEDNWKRILLVPKREFMTIIGHDDLFEPDFLDEINALIQKEPKANLYQTHFKLIDSEGKFIRYCRPIPRNEIAAEFLAARMAEIRDSFGTGYVMRSASYDKLGGIPSFSKLMYADDALWLGLMRDSVKVTSPGVCFSYRLHTGSVSGKPQPEAIIGGLKEYLHLLGKMALEDRELDGVLKLYVPQYVSSVVQHVYHYHLRTKPWGRQPDQNRLSDLERLLEKYAPDAIVEKVPMKFRKRLCRKFAAWLSKSCE